MSPTNDQRPLLTHEPAHIAVIGSAGPASLERSVERGFLALGKQVTLVPYVDWAPSLPLKLKRGGGLVKLGLSALARPALEARLVFELARARPDLVLILKTDDLHAATYAALRLALPGVPLVAFHPDDPWNRTRGLKSGPAHARSAVQMRSVDAMFLWSHALTARAAREGARRVHYLPFACDPALHPRVTDVTDSQRAALGSPICFIGNWDEEREAWLTPLAEANLGLSIWGTDYWLTRCRHEGIRKAYRGRPLIGREQAAAAAASDVLVNVLRRQNKGACNMRTFEIPCVGAFMLHERSAEAAAIFPPGIACDDFATPVELVLACRRWLADPDQRQSVAAEGHRRAMAWTYRHWCASLLDQLARPAP